MKTNNVYRRHLLPRLLLCLTVLFGATSAPAAKAGTIYEELKERDRYSTLVVAIEAAGLEDALSGDGALTLFAPSNQAFSKIPGDVLADLLQKPDELAALLTYHVLGEKISYNKFKTGAETTLQGSDLEITVKRYSSWWRRVAVDEARIVRANIRASNGVIHEISDVLDPAFAPVPTILEIVASAPESFSTLGDLVELAGLSDVLADKHLEWTVFAPTNAAFAAVPQSTIDALLADKALLRKVLLYHLLRGSSSSEDLSSGTYQTLAKQAVETEVEDGVLVRVNESNVTTADISASNGTIHVIDAVLIPVLPQSLTSVIAGRDELRYLLVLHSKLLVWTRPSTRQSAIRATRSSPHGT